MNAIAGGPMAMPMSGGGVMGGGGPMGGSMGGAMGGSVTGGMPTGNGGPTGNLFTSGHGMGGGSTSGHSTNQCIGTKLCMEGCSGQYELGPVGADGCQSCSCKSGNLIL